MSKQISIEEIQQSFFPTKELRLTAEVLAAAIVNEAPFDKHDEIINEFRGLICHYDDVKHKGVPVSSLVRAEDHKRLHEQMRGQRYQVRVQP